MRILVVGIVRVILVALNMIMSIAMIMFISRDHVFSHTASRPGLMHWI